MGSGILYGPPKPADKLFPNPLAASWLRRLRRKGSGAGNASTNDVNVSRRLLHGLRLAVSICFRPVWLQWQLLPVCAKPVDGEYLAEIAESHPGGGRPACQIIHPHPALLHMHGPLCLPFWKTMTWDVSLSSPHHVSPSRQRAAAQQCTGSNEPRSPRRMESGGHVPDTGTLGPGGCSTGNLGL